MPEYYLNCHIYAFCLSFALDIFLGDPVWIYHPVRIIGSYIEFAQKRQNRTGYSDEKKLNNGIILTVSTVFLSGISVLLVLGITYGISKPAGIMIEGILGWFCLALKSLRSESCKVYDALEKGDIDKARSSLSMIVGRDTDALDEEGIIRATVETVAENTSDGVIAPMIYLAIGGPVFSYQAPAGALRQALCPS